MRHLLPLCSLGLAALPVLAGCGDRCQDISRIDGPYAVLHSPDTSGQGDYPWEDVFVGGWSEWDLAYVPGNQTFDLVIDEQPFVGTYTADPYDCEAFTLAFDGTYVGDGGSLHDFSWTGAVVVAGTHLQGTASWTDQWEDPGSGGRGDVELSSVTFTANVRDE